MTAGSSSPFRDMLGRHRRGDGARSGLLVKACSRRLFAMGQQSRKRGQGGRMRPCGCPWTLFALDSLDTHPVHVL